MVTAHGAEYHCVRKKEAIPGTLYLKPSTDVPIIVGILDEEGHEDSSLVSSTEKLRRQLQGLRGSCIEKRIDYWSYVVCPFEKVEQVHYERRKRGTSFNLGEYEAGSEQLVHAYKGGTDDRQSRVTFVCEATQGKTSIVSVTETRMHEYDLVVQTPLACTMSEELQAKQLISMLSGQCLKRLDGWWTYELCFHQNIRQYHTEKNGNVIEYILGKYDVQINQELEDSREVLMKQSPSGKPGYLEKYDQGTTCDLTGEKRWTKVIYACFPAVDMNGIVSVEETSTCGYTIKVSVPALCTHPYFKDSSDSGDGGLELDTVFCLSDTLYGELKNTVTVAQ